MYEMSKEILPGPASIGMANGVSATSDLENASSFSLFFMPLCLLKLPVRSANPDIAMIMPPAIFKEDRVMPKKTRRYFPRKKEVSRIINVFMEAQIAVDEISLEQI